MTAACKVLLKWDPAQHVTTVTVLVDPVGIRSFDVELGEGYWDREQGAVMFDRSGPDADWHDEDAVAEHLGLEMDAFYEVLDKVVSVAILLEKHAVELR